MPDRDNNDDMYNIIKDDFNWLIEDMEQQRKILQDEMIKFVKEDDFSKFDDYRGTREDLEKLIEKIESIRKEYISIIKGEETSKKCINDEEYNYLDDWGNTVPAELLLFGKKYEVSFWRDILLILIDELYKKDKELVNKLTDNEEFRGRKRIYFTYNKNLIDERFYNRTYYGLYVMTNASANTIYDICVKVLRFSGYSEDDLKIKIRGNFEEKNSKTVKIEKDNQDNVIKLPREYASITINRDLFKTIIYSIINRKEEYGTDYIESRKIVEKFEAPILLKTNYTISYHVVINIIKFLKDSQFIDNYEGTKKGKYIVIDDNSLKTWVDNNI